MISSYQITHQTLAILPAYEMEFQAKVIEFDQEILIQQTPLDIIKQNCKDGGSTYEGRKQAVYHHLNFKQKTPIPIHPIHYIYAFPTKSPTDHDCVWLFFYNIKKVTPASPESNEHAQTMILFHSGQQLALTESPYTIQKQYDRTGMCTVVFGSMH
ncbi:competence protein ComK [Gracilibacillus sp. YIM 98692]|uniref:competence protein ComK n=1 Tax=Gracilibacillus sp. YIM 98692 TaxID=2663532 RepID=UPI0013D4A960|nr:competence protein ComK [Gracilibacillus sp. YIM 98692]